MNSTVRPHFPLIAAPPTPFAADGSLRLRAVEAQVARLVADGVDGAFVGGTTGESHSLTTDEREQLATRWAEVTRGTGLRLIVHAGANCLADARRLAAHAARIGASGVAAIAPSYFKPADVDTLVACCAEVAAAAPGIPFHYYELPGLTGIHLPSHELMKQAAERIPNFAGIKFSNGDLVMLQRCVAVAGSRLEVLFGCDEQLLAALALGATGAVGSTYNVAARAYHRMIAAAGRGDLASARDEQLLAVRLVDVLAHRGFLSSLKALMAFEGLDVGPTRLPLKGLDNRELSELKAELETAGVMDWLRR